VKKIIIWSKVAKDIQISKPRHKNYYLFLHVRWKLYFGNEGHSSAFE